MSFFFTKSLGHPVQGVSQQKEELRPQGQANAQVNMIPYPVSGVTRRMPTRLVRAVTPYDTYINFISHKGEQILCIRGTTVDVYDISSDTFESVTPSSPALAYLAVGAGGQLKVRSATLNDTTFFCNPNVTVAEDTAATFPTRYNDLAEIYCLGGQYGRTYKISVTVKEISSGTLTTTTATYTAPDGATATDVEQVSSTYIMAQLDGDWTPSHFTTSLVEDHILVEPDSGYTLTDVTTDDGEGGVTLIPVFKDVKTTDLLPYYGVKGQVVVVAGQEGDQDDAYFEFVPKSDTTLTGADSFGLSGNWVETVKIGDEFAFDWGTLPVRLYRDPSDSLLYLDVAEWEGRSVGDVTSAKTPSILGNPIKDVAVMQSRLVLLGSQSLVFSETSEPLQLWRTSVINVLANSAAVDGNSDSSRGEYTFMVMANNDLTVFSRLGQYVILGNVAITPTSIGLIPSVASSNVPWMPPVASGGSVYSLIRGGDFSGLSEYYKENNSFFVASVSEHVPKYIAGSPTLIAGLSAQNGVYIQTDDDLTGLYAYRFAFDGGKRVQSAWYQLNFTYTIKHMASYSNAILLITRVGSEDIFEALEFGKSSIAELSFIPYLDRYKEYTLGAGATLTLENVHKTGDTLFVSSTAGVTPGMVVDSTYDAGSDTYTISGMSEGDTVLVGHTFESSYSPTRPRMFDANGEVIQSGKLSVSCLWLNVNDTGAFSFTLANKYGTQSYTGDISPRVMGAPTNLIGVEALVSSRVRVPWRGDAASKQVTFSCSGHTPLNISYIEFEGDMRTAKGRR